MAFSFAASIVFGGILGMRYRFWVLIPAVLIVGSVLLVMIAIRHQLFAALLNFGSAAVGLQLGYLAVVIARSIESEPASEARLSSSEVPSLPANVAAFRVRRTPKGT